jgi:hypothetical protein
LSRGVHSVQINGYHIVKTKGANENTEQTIKFEAESLEEARERLKAKNLKASIMGRIPAPNNHTEEGKK